MAELALLICLVSATPPCPCCAAELKRDVAALRATKAHWPGSPCSRYFKQKHLDVHGHLGTGVNFGGNVL